MQVEGWVGSERADNFRCQVSPYISFRVASTKLTEYPHSRAHLGAKWYATCCVASAPSGPKLHHRAKPHLEHCLLVLNKDLDALKQIGS